MIFILIAILGASIGSFLNVLIYRVPLGVNISYPPSFCPNCQNSLKWYHNIPVISWILLKGKCAYCKNKISIRYPVVEIITSFIFLLVFIKNGVNIYSLTTSLTFSLLLALSIIDFKYKAVPDSLNLAALTISFFSSLNIIQNIISALLLAGAFSFLRFYISYYVSIKEELKIKKAIKKAPWLKSFFPKYTMIEAMGEGDIIVAGTIGAILGIELSVIAIFLSAILAIPASLFLRISKRDFELPYIPFLALSLFIVYIFDEKFKIFFNWIIDG